MLLSKSDAIHWATQLYNALPFAGENIVREKGRDYHGVCWNNPDNICYGSLGEAFFAMELYKATGEQRIWDNILAYWEKIVQYGQVTKTNNYSLYSGRLGLAFLCLQLYKISGLTKFLDHAVLIAREYFNDTQSYLKVFDNCSLLDGQSSHILFCLCLYRETGDDKWSGIINRYVQAILKDAYLQDDRIYWHGTTGHSKRKNGWAYGCSGIAMVLLELGKTFNKDYYFELAEKVLDVDALAGFDDKRPASLIHEWPGTALIGLYHNHLTGNDRFINLWRSFEALTAGTNWSDADGNINYDIEYGVAGWGMAFNEAYALTGDHKYRLKAFQLATYMVEQCQKGKINNAGHGLFQGIAGVGYFLLQCFNDTAVGSILMPGRAYMPMENNATAQGYTKTGNAMPPGLPTLKKWILCRNFRRSIAIVDRHYPNELEMFFNRHSAAKSSAFREFVDGLDKSRLLNEEMTSLQLVLEKEVFAVALKTTIDGCYFPDEARYIKMLKTILDSSEAYLLGLRLKVSPKVIVFEQDERLDLQGPLTQEKLTWILSDYGERFCVFKVNKFDVLEELCYSQSKIYLDLFMEAQTVQMAADGFCNYFMCQDEAIVNRLKERFNVQDVPALRNKIKNEVIRSARNLLTLDILVVDEELP